MAPGSALPTCTLQPVTHKAMQIEIAILASSERPVVALVIEIPAPGKAILTFGCRPTTVFPPKVNPFRVANHRLSRGRSAREPSARGGHNRKRTPRCALLLLATSGSRPV